MEISSVNYFQKLSPSSMVEEPSKLRESTNKSSETSIFQPIIIAWSATKNNLNNIFKMKNQKI